ncbi:hypothetical protein F4677DRAFT_443045 [Hypoxylon crocopeplum]|nr:hypothetical protein F4677DRAFT_443045 [Hypoxylon crocopeplum]
MKVISLCLTLAYAVFATAAVLPRQTCDLTECDRRCAAAGLHVRGADCWGAAPVCDCA